MNVWAIIVAAGSGTRFKSKTLKPFVLLKQKPLIAYSLKVFNNCPAVKGIVLVGHKDYLNRFVLISRAFKKVRGVVSGGKMRTDSVKCGLAALPSNVDVVLVHDGARPLIDAGTVGRLIKILENDKAAIVAVPVKATIKQVDSKTLQIQGTPKRDMLWEAQTPQGFRKDVLVKAHARFSKMNATDDAVLVEGLGIKVKVVMGDYRNIKITTPEDLKLAKELMS